MAEQEHPSKIQDRLSISLPVHDPAQELLINLGHVYTRVTRLMSSPRLLGATLKKHGLTVALFNTMAFIKYSREAGDLSQRDLGRKLVVSGANVTGLVDKLEKKRLVVRARHKTDRRKWNISLTKKGDDLLKEILPVYAESLKTLTEGFGEAQMKQLDRLLSAWADLLGERE
jgi:MarR family 2-MHQ and catechol resistance regulon transcriptional repressor